MNNYRDAIAELLEKQLDHGYRQAAEHTSETGPRQRRVLRGIALVTTFVIGLLMVTAYQRTQAAEPKQTRTKQALVARVRDQRAATDQLQDQAAELREQYTRERQDALTGSTAGQHALAQLRELEATLGLVEVRGPGITVTIGDGKERGAALVQDRDLQTLVNALWFCGAEAIAIDGRRLTAASTIRTAGDAILVDFLPVTSPYEISAIGDQETLEDSFVNNEVAHRFFGYVDEYGMTFTVKQKSRLTLPGTTISPPRFATQK